MLISAVVLTYNSIGCVGACLDALCAQAAGVEVTVVDNGSADGTCDFVKGRYPRVRLIENARNLGACRARNQGIAASKGDWLLALDCDTVLARNFIASAHSLIRRVSERVGMVQPKMLQGASGRMYSAGICFSFFLRRFYDIGQGRRADEGFDAEAYPFGACAAAALYRRRMLEEIREETGYFDERFFFLAEDVDLALRARQKGWGALYAPKLLCYHRGGSSAFGRDVRQYLCWRNRRMILVKCGIPLPQRAAMRLCYDLPRLCFLVCANRHVRNEVFFGRSPLFLETR